MADERSVEREISRRIKEEIERIRDAEGRVEGALESVRQARRRVELIARELEREEPSIRSWRSEPPAGWAARREAPPAIPPEEIPPVPERKRKEKPAPPDDRAKLVGIGVGVALLVAAIGWLAIRGLQRNEPAVAVAERSAPAAVTTPPPQAIVEPTPAAAADPLTVLPTDPAARVALYDSLFTARSSLFDPLLTAVEAGSTERPVDRAVAAWRDGSIDVQQADLVHSAFVQHVLKREIDTRIEIDGQLLRNPCRGRSCVALLTVWKTQREKYGLSEVPKDATTDVDGLRRVEVAVVLSRMKELRTPGGESTDTVTGD